MWLLVWRIALQTRYRREICEYTGYLGQTDNIHAVDIQIYVKRVVKNSAEPYLHSLVDDLESFYYASRRVAVFDDGVNGGKCDGTAV